MNEIVVNRNLESPVRFKKYRINGELRSTNSDKAIRSPVNAEWETIGKQTPKFLPVIR